MYIDSVVKAACCNDAFKLWMPSYAANPLFTCLENLLNFALGYVIDDDTSIEKATGEQIWILCAPTNASTWTVDSETGIIDELIVFRLKLLHVYLIFSASNCQVAIDIPVERENCAICPLI